MVETLSYSKVYLEDIDIGTGYREVTLQDGRIVLLRQVSLGALFSTSTLYISASNGAAVLTISGAIEAGWRVAGVTAEILQTFGNTGGLENIAIGDSGSYSRWGSLIERTAGTITSPSDFEGDTLPLYTTATDILITAIGGLFDATGQIELKVHYFTLAH